MKLRPLVNILGKIVGIPRDSYLDPTSLGSGTPDINKWLRGDGIWANIGGGSGLTTGDVVFVASLDDLPAPVSNVITLADDITYYFTNNIDLNGDRLVGGSNTTILGASSENCTITSTGLGAGVPLFYTEWTTPVRHITFKDVDTAIEIDGTVNPPVALDWTGVNFLNVDNVGTIATCDNFIFDKGSFLGAQNLVFSGTVGTIALNNSLFRGDGSAGTLITVDSTATITRRFRIIYSSVIAFGSTQAIDVDASATIPTEGFILDTISFSGGGTYLAGIDHTSNNSLFLNCTNIINTAVNGQLYMQGNATATTVSATNTFYKVAGTTTASADNSKFSHSNNRLTCDATISRKYLIQCNLSFTAGNNNVCEFGFYDSQLAAIRTPSRTKSTANASGRAEGVTFFCVLNMSSGDYLEIHCANTSVAVDITVEQMNFTITEIK